MKKDVTIAKKQERRSPYLKPEDPPGTSVISTQSAKAQEATTLMSAAHSFQSLNCANMKKKVTIDKKQEWLPPYLHFDDSFDSFESSDSEMMIPAAKADEATTLHSSEEPSSSGQADEAKTLLSGGLFSSGQTETTTTTSKMIKAMVTLSYVCAWLCILFVPLWKVFDTSFLFRERDEPSMFDKTVDYFSSESSWPFAKRIDNGKDTYRLYFFVMPFFLGFLFLFAKGIGENYCKVSSFKLPSLLRYRFSFGLSLMDIFLIDATVIYSAILLWVRMKRSLTKGAKKLTFLYQDSKDPLEPYSWEGLEVMGKSLGVLTITLLAWFVLMPISRRSVLLDLLNVPREVALKCHRWLGWYSLSALLAHTGVYIVVWVHANGHPIFNPEGNLLRHMMLAGSCNDGACDPATAVLHTEMMYGFAALAIMLVMCATAFNFVRRRCYEAFYYVHQLFVLMILFTAFHYDKTPLYLLPGIVMLLIDKTIGYLSYFGTVSASTKTLSADMFELKVQKDPTVNSKAGQFVFVNVPSVSLLQWHPITVTWSNDDDVVLHIRARGGNTWTQKVYDHVLDKKGPIKVKLDGFYGKDLVSTYSLDKREAIVFACGGCGLTFPFSVIEKLCEMNDSVPVYLHWVTRTKQEFAAFQMLLENSAARFQNLTISVWVTLNGHPENEAGEFCKATTPEIALSQEEQAPPIHLQLLKRLWRPYQTWLWSTPVHSLVTALAILMGATGYAVARHYELRGNLSEIDMMLRERFVGLSFTVIFPLALLFGLVAPRILPSIVDLSIIGINDRRYQEIVPEFDLDGIELGNAPHVKGTGRRPNYEDIFEEVELVHDGNVVVFACGPEGLVKDVRSQTQRRLNKGWTMIEEEWEW